MIVKVTLVHALTLAMKRTLPFVNAYSTDSVHGSGYDNVISNSNCSDNDNGSDKESDNSKGSNIGINGSGKDSDSDN